MARQRRAFKRYFEDISILIGEANYTDEKMLKERGKQMSFDTSPCLTMSIYLFLDTMLQFLHRGFELELYGLAEMPEYFNYLAFIYEMQTINRQ